MTAFKRIDKPSHIDRSKPISFQFDGKSISGFTGDTLASALLASGPCFGLIKRHFHNVKQLVDLFGGNDQWWAEGNGIAPWRG